MFSSQKQITIGIFQPLAAKIGTLSTNHTNSVFKNIFTSEKVLLQCARISLNMIRRHRHIQTTLARRRSIENHEGKRMLTFEADILPKRPLTSF